MLWVFTTFDLPYGFVTEQFITKSLPTWEEYQKLAKIQLPAVYFNDMKYGMERAAKTDTPECFWTVALTSRFFIKGFRNAHA